MSVVYRAVHQVLGWTVALKTLRPGGETRTDLLARFRIEGEVIARFEHPNIVRIRDFNESEGVPYLSMELVEGGTLAQKLAGGPFELRAAVELVRVIASAIEYAHQRNVIHRDLKPSNVLIARDGTPKVADFGLAKVLDAGREGLTETDAIMGTPPYMAPEQAAGRTAEIGPRTDVYALGAILYELLTGRPPFLGESKIKTLALVQEGNVVPPSWHRAEVPADLEAVCLKCLATSPCDRFASADALAQELARWLVGQRTLTRRPGRLRRAARIVRRRARALVGALLLTAGLIGAAAAFLPRTGGSAVPDGESEAVRRELEAELDRGRPVTLVGETGWPKWFRWRAGKDAQRTHIEPDGTFSAEMLDQRIPGLLELLPDPRTDRYKLTAQVRHDQGRYGGFVGLYVAHRTYPRQPRDIQFFAEVRFNAVNAAPRVVGYPKSKGELIPENHTQEMALVLRLQTDYTGATEDNDWLLDEQPGPRLLALQPRNGVWHDLEVTVTPDEISAVVGGNRMTLPAAALNRETLHQSAVAVRKWRPQDPALQNLRPEFAPRGGLGLVLYPLSAASVRRVTVTPLPAGP
jgi:serine/threonine-protein kinase